MTVADKLALLGGTKASIKTAIENQGVAVPPETTDGVNTVGVDVPGVDAWFTGASAPLLLEEAPKGVRGV